VSEAGAQSPAELAERGDNVAQVQAILATLSAQEQTVYRLYYVEDMTLLEIGTLLGFSPNHPKQAASRVQQIIDKLNTTVKRRFTKLTA
jgi:RNA polymerase sigma factor (sigma-70 family)